VLLGQRLLRYLKQPMTGETLMPSESNLDLNPKSQLQWTSKKKFDLNSNEFQLKAILHDALDVEALCRHGMGDIFRGQGLEDGGLPRVVQAQDQDPGFHVILSKL